MVSYVDVSSKKLKFTTHLDWSDKGMDLNKFLKKYENVKATDKENTLKNKRVFYVISPNAENIFKIGIAGVNDGQAIGRFQQYRLYYGNENKKNKCTGVKVHFVCKTNYNDMTEPTNSYIHKLEKCMKTKLKNNLVRGGEWVKTSLKNIKDAFDVCSGSVKEIETIPRRSKRLEGFENKRYDVEKLLDIVKNKGQKSVLVQWKGIIEPTFVDYKIIEEDMPEYLQDLENKIKQKNKKIKK